VTNQRVQLMLTLLGRPQTINVPMRVLAAAA
jgi:hypothetical protein